MAEVKGVQLKATMLFLTQRFGEQAVKAAINSLSPEDRRLIPPVVLDSNWYPFSVWRPVRRVSRMLNTAPGLDFAVAMGKFIAEYVFTGVYKSLLTDDPIDQIAKFSWISEFFYKDTRKLTTDLLSDYSCAVRYHFEPGVMPARSTCATTMGFWARTLELSGASEVTDSHPRCVNDMDDFCEFLLEWK